MAEQEHFFTYSGKAGNKVGYRRGKKYFERQKPASYQPPEESLKSANEFGLASKSSALLRNAFSDSLLRQFKTDLHNRLSKRFVEILRSGPIEKKGSRKVFDGELGLLKGFEFNKNQNLDSLIRVKLLTELQDEEVWFKLSPFKWSANISAPPQAERAWIGVSYAWIDFMAASYFTSKAPPIILKVGEDSKGGKLKIPIQQQKEWALVVILTICFDSQSSGALRIVGNRLYQAGQIAEALHFSKGKLVQRENIIAENKQELPESTNPDIFWEEL